MAHNQQYLSPGMNFMLINGLAFDINDFDLFGEPLVSSLHCDSELCCQSWVDYPVLYLGCLPGQPVGCMA